MERPSTHGRWAPPARVEASTTEVPKTLLVSWRYRRRNTSREHRLIGAVEPGHPALVFMLNW